MLLALGNGVCHGITGHTVSLVGLSTVPLSFAFTASRLQVGQIHVVHSPKSHLGGLCCRAVHVGMCPLKPAHMFDNAFIFRFSDISKIIFLRGGPWSQGAPEAVRVSRVPPYNIFNSYGIFNIRLCASSPEKRLDLNSLRDRRRSSSAFVYPLTLFRLSRF
jgi:hypothetical protein